MMLIANEAALAEFCHTAKRLNGPLVVTNGCFDLIHAGHVKYLQAARKLGGLLLVGLNSDRAVYKLKGPARPINRQHDRALVLSELRCVDAVYIFDSTTATRFLTVAKPDIWAKGGDYKLGTLDPSEVKAVTECGGSIKLLPLRAGLSTTRLINASVAQR